MELSKAFSRTRSFKPIHHVTRPRSGTAPRANRLPCSLFLLSPTQSKFFEEDVCVSEPHPSYDHPGMTPPRRIQISTTGRHTARQTKACDNCRLRKHKVRNPPSHSPNDLRGPSLNKDPISNAMETNPVSLASLARLSVFTAKSPMSVGLSLGLIIEPAKQLNNEAGNQS